MQVETEKKTIDPEKIIKRLTKEENKGQSFTLSEHEISGLCLGAKRIMMSQPMLLELRPPINVCGDFHGQFIDLCKMFRIIGQPELGENFLFLGDYVDRGKQSLECICLLLAYKMKYKDNFFLLRGNHECSQTNKVYGFYDQCKRRLSVKTWKVFSDCFNCFPIAATIGGRIFCVHGGLSPQLVHLSQINQIRRPLEMQKDTLICDLLWSDPLNISGWKENFQRGVSFYYGNNIIKHFLDKYQFDLICRSHQVMEDGYQFFDGRNVLTIFSAPNYCGSFDNLGAVLVVDQHMKCQIKHLEKSSQIRKFSRRSVTPLPVKSLSKQENSSLHKSKEKKSVKIIRQRTPTRMISK